MSDIVWAQTPANTVYRFPPGHVFGVIDPDEVLYECLGSNSTMIEARPVAPNAMKQIFMQRDFAALVADGKIDPRIAENDDARRRVAARNPDIESARDLCDAEREEIVFLAKVVRRIDQLYRDKKTSLTDAALQVTIPTVMHEVEFGPKVDDPVGEPQRRGRKGLFYEGAANVGGSVAGRRISARKLVSSYAAPSPSTVREWRRKLIAHDWDELAIRDHRKGRLVSGLTSPRRARTMEIFGTWVGFYMDRNRPTGATLYRLMIGSVDLADVNRDRAAKGRSALPFADAPTFAAVNAERGKEGRIALVPPSRSSFERAIRKLDRFQVCVARHGMQEAKRRFKIAGKPEAAVAPGERVALDCWTFQLMAVKLPKDVWAGIDDRLVDTIRKLRLTICVAICEATRMPLGARLGATATGDLALRTLEMVCKDKSAISDAAGCLSVWNQTCTPECVPTDSGSEFIADVVRWAIRDIGSTNEIGMARQPDSRGALERFFRTSDLQFAPMFQGRTFSNVGDKGSYDPVAVANVLGEALGKAFVRYLVDVYANSPHSGLGGQTPADAWEEKSARYGVLPPPAPKVMRAVFGLADTRRIQNAGIRVAGLHYRSEALAKLRMRVGQADVRIRVALDDLGAISVAENAPGAAWFTVPCTIDMAGVSIEEWLTTAAELRRRHAAQAKLREPMVLAALRDLRLMGLSAAAAAGIGPSVMTMEQLRREEDLNLRHLRIVAATRRGGTLWEVDGAERPDEGDESLAVLASEPSPQVDATVEGSPARRRRNLPSDFLGGE